MNKSIHNNVHYHDFEYYDETEITSQYYEYISALAELYEDEEYYLAPPHYERNLRAKIEKCFIIMMEFRGLNKAYNKIIEIEEKEEEGDEETLVQQKNDHASVTQE